MFQLRFGTAGRSFPRPGRAGTARPRPRRGGSPASGRTAPATGRGGQGSTAPRPPTASTRRTSGPRGPAPAQGGRLLGGQRVRVEAGRVSHRGPSVVSGAIRCRRRAENCNPGTKTGSTPGSGTREIDAEPPRDRSADPDLLAPRPAGPKFGLPTRRPIFART